MNGKTYGIGNFEFLSVRQLRERVEELGGMPGKLKVCAVTGEAKRMHKQKENKGSLFQVASQFNVLEMVGYSVTPEDGVTRYAGDPTQGPACAIAAGAGTIYRNYFVPVNGKIGQTERNQLDGLQEIGKYFSEKLGRPLRDLWRMENGYCLCSREGLHLISQLIESLSSEERDELIQKLMIGIQLDVEVTYHLSNEGIRPSPRYVSQAYCSALPVSYCGHSRELWAEFATLVLEGCYEATLCTGVLNAKKRGTNVVYLTCVGGGAFGNSRVWIEKAMRRVFKKYRNYNLDVRIVCYGSIDHWIDRMLDELPEHELRSAEGEPLLKELKTTTKEEEKKPEKEDANNSNNDNNQDDLNKST